MLVLDTSAFINGWNVHYAGPVFAPVWELVDRLLRTGVAIMPREVFNETQAKADLGLQEWVADRKHLAIDPVQAVQQLAGRLDERFDSSPTRDRADPWVVAEAQHRRWTVVTYEGTNTLTGARTPKWRSKMPGICESLGVDCCILPEALNLAASTLPPPA